MRVNQVSTYNQNFKAVKFLPQPKEWNPRVLEAVLDSVAVKNAIKENESIGLDTLIYYRDKINYQPCSKKINEFGVVRLKKIFENMYCRFEYFHNWNGVEAVIDYIKTEDAKLNNLKKREEFDKFIASLVKK